MLAGLLFYAGTMFGVWMIDLGIDAVTLSFGGNLLVSLGIATFILLGRSLHE